MIDYVPRQLDDGWSVASIESKFNLDSISGLNRWLDENHEYHNTHAVLIEFAGNLVYERYFEGEDNRYGAPLGVVNFSAKTLHDTRSVSKSVTSLLLGIAIKNEYQTVLQQPITQLLDRPEQKYKEPVLLKHVLTMTEGYKWDQWNHPSWDEGNDEYNMDQVKDPVGMVLDQEVVNQPGTEWTYSSGSTELIAACIEKITGSSFLDFADEALFGPLGIHDFEWLGSENWLPPGRPAASSGLRLSARSLAKIGSVVLNHGVWKDSQVVPAEWVDLSTERHVDQILDSGIRGKYGFGFQWWVGQSRSFPSYEIIAGFGNGGQQILVVPAHQVAVTVLAGNYGRRWQWGLNWVLGQVVAARRAQAA